MIWQFHSAKKKIYFGKPWSISKSLVIQVCLSTSYLSLKPSCHKKEKKNVIEYYRCMAVVPARREKLPQVGQ